MYVDSPSLTVDASTFNWQFTNACLHIPANSCRVSFANFSSFYYLQVSFLFFTILPYRLKFVSLTLTQLLSFLALFDVTVVFSGDTVKCKKHLLALPVNGRRLLGRGE